MKEHEYDENRPMSAEERLTAYLMDELEPAERERVEAELADSPALQERLDKLSATVELLRASEGEAQLSSFQRGALREAASGALATESSSEVPLQGRLLTFRRSAAAAGVIATAAALALVFNVMGLRESFAPGSVENSARTRTTMIDSIGDTGHTELNEFGQAAGGKQAGAAAKAPTSRFSKTESSNAPTDDLAQIGYARKNTTRSGEGPALEELGYASGEAPARESREARTLLAEMGYTPPASQSPASPAKDDVQRLSNDIGLGGGAGGRYYGRAEPADAPEALQRQRAEYERVDGFAEPEADADRFAPEEQRALEEIGYVDYDDRNFEEAPEPALELHDGYGRRYRDHQIIEHCRRRPNESPRDMFFRYYGDNAAVWAKEDALSTFAADVDTASYPLVRNYLVNRNLPPKAAVRTEEFLNYFKNDLQPPAEGDFAIHLEAAPSLFGEGEGSQLLKIGVKAREVSRKDRKPLNLVFVIDSSGSMARENRLELVKRSLNLLIDQLGEEDQVGIVTFSTQARKVLDPTPAHERWQIRQAVRGLSTGGSTNAEAGLLIGYELLEQHFVDGAVNRIILCSDGVANTGQTDQEKILDRVRRFSERQIDLTAVGVGMGNHNDVFLEQIADKGNGSCHYVDDFEEAKRVFVEQFTGTLQTVARDVKIQVQFSPDVVTRWRQLGYENRSLADRDFRNDAVDAGEVGAGHEVVALYELQTLPLAQIADYEKVPAAVTVRLRWFPDGASEAVEMEQSLTIDQFQGQWEEASARFRLSTVAAQFAEVLRRSYWAREDSYQQLAQKAEELASELNEQPVRELRDMIRRTKVLIDRLPRNDELSLLVDEYRQRCLREAELEALSQRGQDVEGLLEEVRRQNAELEAKLDELLSERGG